MSQIITSKVGNYNNTLAKNKISKANDILTHTHDIEIPTIQSTFYCPDYIHGSLISNDFYQIYTTPCKGFLRFFAVAGQAVVLLTHSIQLFNNRIYQFNTDPNTNNGYPKGALIKYNNKYYQCINNYTYTNKSTAIILPTNTTYWKNIPKSYPVIMHTTTTYTAEDDAGFDSLIIPIEANINIAIIRFGDVGTNQMIASAAASYYFSCMFMSLDGTTKKLEKANIDLSTGLLYDTYYGCLYGLFRNLKN